MRKLLAWIVCLICVLLVASLPATSVSAQDYGIASKKPIIGGACPGCPWGALADKVKAAMKPLGYDVQVCYNCSGIESVRIVSERRKPLPLTPQQARDRPPSPNGEVDFGVVNLDFFVDAYRGTGRYKADGPRTNLRLIANIEDPQYYLVATRSESWISDLRQVKERRLPVRILADDSIRAEMILKYYGISKEELASWGGSLNSTEAANRYAYDVVICFANSLNNTPESNVWYELSQKSDLRFLQLPDDLLISLAKASEWEIGDTPVQLMRGMDKPIKTIMSSGTVIYGRADMPDSFAYDVAKALDEQKRLLIFSIIPLSYNSDIVWQARGVPLHKGAERYYREKGYIKSKMPDAGGEPAAQVALAASTPFAQTNTADAAKDPLYQAKGDHKRAYFFADDNKERPYRIYVPSIWDKRRKLPMIVVLHGGGLNEDAPFDRGPADLKGILAAQAEKHGYIVVAPNGGNITPDVGYGGMYPKPPRDAAAAPPTKSTAPAGAIAPTPPRPPQTPMTKEQIVRENALSEKDVMNVVERTASEYNVDRSRIYLMGNSMGEIGTLYLAQKYLPKWCAIAPSGGPIDPAVYEYANIKGLSGAFFIQGERDASGIEPNRVLSEGFKKQGVDTKYVVVPGGDHANAWYMVLAEIFDFFNAHRCSR